MTADLLTKVHTRLWQWSHYHEDGLARPYSRKMEKDYGRQWYNIRKQLEQDGKIFLAEPAFFRSETNHKGERLKGRVAGYRVEAPKHPVITATGSPVKAYTRAEQRYLETHARTNLTAPMITLGRNGDTREYTDFTVMPSAKRATITIDGEALVCIDITNAFFLGIAAAVPNHLKGAVEFKSICNTGMIYDAVAEVAGVTRDVAKLPINIAANNPKRLKFNNPEASLVWRAFSLMFPGVARWLREQARNGAPWKMGNMFEGAIRNKALEQAYAVLGYAPLQCHDGFYVKVSDVSTFIELLHQIHARLPLKVSGHQFTSPLVCKAPRMSSAQTAKLSHWFDFGDVKPPGLDH